MMFIPFDESENSENRVFFGLVVGGNLVKGLERFNFLFGRIGSSVGSTGSISMTSGTLVSFFPRPSRSTGEPDCLTENCWKGETRE